MHDVGFITIRNRSANHTVILSSHKRETKEITARYALDAGETQHFNYRGFWCIRLELADPTVKVAWEQVIEVVEYKVDCGNHSNLLGMA